MKFIRNTWSRGLLGKLVVGLGALIVGCCGLTTLTVMVAPRSASPASTAIATTKAPTQTAIPATATSVSTSTAMPPTTTPEPTATEVLSTATSEPTATEVPPTATSEPTKTPVVITDKQLFALQLIPIANSLGDAFATIAELSTKAGNDTSLFFSNDWKIDVGVQMAVISQNADKLRNLEIPPGLERVGEKVNALASELDLVTLNFTRGIDKLDAKKLKAASDAMNRSTKLFTEIGTLLKELTRTRSGRQCTRAIATGCSCFCLPFESPRVG